MSPAPPPDEKHPPKPPAEPVEPAEPAEPTAPPGSAENDEHAAFEADFSDHYEKALPDARARALEQHLETCPRCRAEYQRFRETVEMLSGLHKVSAPERFEKQVEDTIHRRSAGRFFGRKAFGDRVPFEILAIVGLVLVVALFLLLRWSATGSVHDPLVPRSPASAPPDLRDKLPRP